MILVVCALPAELRDFGARAGVEILAVGVGPVEAAAATARALAHGHYRAVVNAGIAGAFRGHGAVGDAFLVVEEHLADFGLEGGGRLNLPGGATLAATAAAAGSLIAACAGLPYPCGRGVTVSQITTTAATAERLSAAYAADVESMEGFSVLRAAELASVPGLEVRGISNYVGDRAQSAWDFGAGARAASQALAALLDRLELAA